MKLKLSLVGLFLAAAALVFVPPASAQTLYGSLVGNVTDPSDASVPGATVVVINPQTGFTREATTNERGAFLLSDLQPGAYDVKITATSFAVVTNSGVAVSAGVVVRVDVHLQLSTAAEAITVSATSATLQTDRADVRTEMVAQQVQDLPVSGQRNYTALTQLVPGVSPPHTQHSIVSNPQENLVTNVNGADDERNNTRVDGASSSHVWLPRLSLYAPPLEAIETVSIVTNSMDAEQGISGGSVVSVITKSGTNEFHAVAFEYNMDSAFAVVAVLLGLILVHAHHIAARILDPDFFHLQRRGIVGVVAFGMYFRIAAGARHHRLGFRRTPHAHAQDVLPPPQFHFRQRLGADHPPVGNDADRSDSEPALQPFHDGNQALHVSRVARIDLTVHPLVIHDE